jgi:hypothetical protein
MKSSTRKPPTLTKAPPRRKGGGYKLGPRPAKPIPPDAIWLTSNQVCARAMARGATCGYGEKFATIRRFRSPDIRGGCRYFWSPSLTNTTAR